MVQYPIDASEGATLMPRPPTGTLEKHRKSYFFRVRMPDGSRPRIPFGECSQPRAKEKAATSKERRDEMIAKYLKERAAARVREGAGDVGGGRSSPLAALGRAVSS